MDNYGLLNKYPVNRPLTSDEIARQLKQKVRSGSMPWSQLSVIKMNSTYLECVDKFYDAKGIGTFLGLTMFILFSVLFVVSLLATYETIGDWPVMRPSEKKEILLIGIPVLIALPFVLYLFWHILKKETFQYTHYPMRFNRKTRKVHVWRQDGTVMTEDWDKLFFTLCANNKKIFSVRGHRLATDGVTVLETFSLPYYAELRDPDLRVQWEYVRRYMEEPESLPKLANQLGWILDIDGKRESFWHGFNRLQADYTGFSVLAITGALQRRGISVLHFTAQPSRKTPPQAPLGGFSLAVSTNSRRAPSMWKTEIVGIVIPAIGIHNLRHSPDLYPSL